MRAMGLSEFSYGLITAARDGFWNRIGSAD